MCILSAALEAVLWSRRALGLILSLAEVNSLDRWPTPSYVLPDECPQQANQEMIFPSLAVFRRKPRGFSSQTGG